MRMYDIIRKKRDGFELDKSEIEFFVKGYTKGTVPDYQASALCMAILFRGMTERETVTLTECMAYSGDTIDLSRFGDTSVDKHSTGGVGDKTSLVICPIVASLGGKVAKMSGRGLGHTGGTVDKLESIPGYRTTLSEEEFMAQVEKVGVAVIGQSADLTPADKKLYALRDVTATVDSIPLITSSVMSKKIASGSKNIVLDVKVGSGAFMKTANDAAHLAENMVKIGKNCGRNIAALITDMDRPLGNAVGNSLEVAEAVDVLKNGKKGDLYDVCVALATEMTALLKKTSPEEARAAVVGAIESGRAFEKMKEWIAAQGGDVSYIEDTSLFPKAKHIVPIESRHDGYIAFMDAESVGSAAAVLGAGRSSKEDKIDFSAGITLSKKTGDAVKRSDVIAYLHTNNESAIGAAEEKFISALRFEDTPPKEEKTIHGIIR